MRILISLLMMSLALTACEQKSGRPAKSHAELLQNQVVHVKTELANYRTRRAEAPRILPADFSEITDEERMLMNEQRIQFQAEKHILTMNLYRLREEVSMQISIATEQGEKSGLAELKATRDEIESLIKELDPDAKLAPVMDY